jgi:hypothetical protein
MTLPLAVIHKDVPHYSYPTDIPDSAIFFFPLVAILNATIKQPSAI